MHLVLLGADLFAAFDDFVAALKAVGATVSGIGWTARSRLRGALRRHLDDWRAVRSPFDPRQVEVALRDLARARAIDRLETLDERLIEVAAAARQATGLPGLSVAAARLCRDKPAMKQALRAAGLPCAEFAAVDSLASLAAFAERVGYPLVLKPRAGLGSLRTYRLESGTELRRAARELAVDRGESAVVEEFVAGHEGIYDTVTIAGEPRLEFIAHYFPGVLEAISSRQVAPQIVATNRVGAPGYEELRRVGRQVIRALGIETGATHMEWFFGPKGLKVSEIGARPPGDRIWDLYGAAHEIDLPRQWALAVAKGRIDGQASCRFAAGSVQVRPSRDGRVKGYVGLREVMARCRPWIFARHLPRPGSATLPLDNGYLANAWFRLRHPDYDELRRLLDWIGRTLRVDAG